MPSSDEVKKQKIIDQLTWNDSLNAKSIQVKVSGNTALLEGMVPNYATKISAATNANMVEGINHVENNLKVELPVKSNLPDDKEITDNILNILKWQSNVSTENLKVESNEGIVTLSGTTETLWGKNKAEDIVNGIHGVLGVVNKLDVNKSRTVKDIEMEEDIKKAFERSPIIDENKISVDVNKGTVHLTGSVANFPIKKEAIDIATYTKGVNNVIGDITIE
ncbi:MAG: BON domain-containing protein [Bacteroidales bacterium]